MSYIIEIATTDYATTAAAVAGGADRIELCSALSEGGLTPSSGMLRRCRADFRLPIFPILRPRGGDFLYGDEELRIIEADLTACRDLGYDGVVFGMLDANGKLPLQLLSRLVALAYPMECTFHRAFDRCRDPFETLEQLIGLGFQRILTSGQKPTAPEGAGLLHQLVQQADGRIVIMPGSGVRPDNIRALADTTGATEFHSSMKIKSESAMRFRHPDFSASDFLRDAIDPDTVRLMRKNLKA